MKNGYVDEVDLAIFPQSSQFPNNVVPFTDYDDQGLNSESDRFRYFDFITEPEQQMIKDGASYDKVKLTFNKDGSPAVEVVQRRYLGPDTGPAERSGPVALLPFHMKPLDDERNILPTNRIK